MFERKGEKDARCSKPCGKGQGDVYGFRRLKLAQVLKSKLKRITNILVAHVAGDGQPILAVNRLQWYCCCLEC